MLKPNHYLQIMMAVDGMWSHVFPGMEDSGPYCVRDAVIELIQPFRGEDGLSDVEYERLKLAIDSMNALHMQSDPEQTPLVSKYNFFCVIFYHVEWRDAAEKDFQIRALCQRKADLDALKPPPAPPRPPPKVIEVLKPPTMMDRLMFVVSGVLRRKK
jgi:hypothetical protein